MNARKAIWIFFVGFAVMALLLEITLLILEITIGLPGNFLQQNYMANAAICLSAGIEAIGTCYAWEKKQNKQSYKMASILSMGVIPVLVPYLFLLLLTAGPVHWIMVLPMLPAMLIGLIVGFNYVPGKHKNEKLTANSWSG